MTNGSLSRAQTILQVLEYAQYGGVTVAEIREMFPEEPGNNDHHGSWSGQMSLLHRDGSIERLQEQRGGCEVYVLPEWVEGRQTKPQGRKPTNLEMVLAHWMQPEKDGDFIRARKYPSRFATVMAQAWAEHCPEGSQLDHRIKIERGET